MQEANSGAGKLDPWRVYKSWFWAAAIYNAAWGAVVSLYPGLLLKAFGQTAAQQAESGPLPAILASCLGMIVGVYAIGYACVALDPRKFWPFALIGLVGKVLGPIGWLAQHLEGHLAWPSIWINVTNDFIWWPSFIALLIKVRRERIPLSG